MRLTDTWLSISLPLLVASITFAAPHNSLRTFAPVGGQRTTYIIL
jgi:hypothetical protein